MRYRIIAILAVLAVVATCASAAYQRPGVMQMADGEGRCPQGSPCPVLVSGAGFPIPFLVDKLGISVEGSLDFFVDEFRPVAFAQDTLCCFGLGLLVVLLNFYRMENS